MEQITISADSQVLSTSTQHLEEDLKRLQKLADVLDSRIDELEIVYHVNNIVHYSIELILAITAIALFLIK